MNDGYFIRFFQNMNIETVEQDLRDENSFINRHKFSTKYDLDKINVIKETKDLFENKLFMHLIQRATEVLLVKWFEFYV